MPKSRTPPTPSVASRWASASARSGLKRACPRRDEISSRRPRPETTNKGATSVAEASRVSRTSARSAPLARRRRGRSIPGPSTIRVATRSRIAALLQAYRSDDFLYQNLRCLFLGLRDDPETKLTCDLCGTRPDRDGGQRIGA